MKKVIFYSIIGGIIVAAFSVRFFGIGEWLHYELDQARDFRIIKAAVEYGPGELPLQGPKAAGNVVIADESGALTDKTTLRLGPLFYYIEYISALIFGATPVGSVMLIVILSVLTVPLVFVFARRYFTQAVALGITALMALGLFFVTYSRFGWNPNLMPFFMTLFAYSLLRASDVNGSVSAQSARWWRRLSVQRGTWLVVASVALAFVGQMHFLAFTTAPVIAMLYVAWSHRAFFGRRGIALRYWVMAVGIFALLQTPLIVNDIKTGGENAKAFAAALTQKSSKDTHTLAEKVVRNVGNHAKYYWIIVTGDQRAELPTLSDGDIKCDHTCRKGLVRGGIALLALFVGILWWVVSYWRARPGRRRDFLRIVFLWGIVVFVAYIPLAYSMAPRFFLMHGVIALVLFGIVVQTMVTCRRAIMRFAGWGILTGAIISNTFFIAQDFRERARAATDPQLRIATDYILKEKTRMGLGQMRSIMAYIEQRHAATGWPVWLHAQPEFKRAFWERIDTAGIPRFGAPKNLERAYREGLYFIIIRTQSDQESYLREVLTHADLSVQRVFGTLTLYELKPHNDVVIAERPETVQPRRNPRFSSNAQVRYLWRQIFDDEK